MLTEGESKYSYDDNGNLISKTGPDETTIYEYDYENRLILSKTTTIQGINRVEYTYDVFGNRVQKVIDEVNVINYVVDLNTLYARVLEERDADGNLIAAYVHSDMGVILQSRNGVKSYYHYDGLGSTRLLTDETQSITDTYTYDAFGNIISSTGNTVNEFLFTGEQYDANIGFYYLRARYMDPSVGRFITADPFGGFMFEPLSLHKYLYANADPVNKIDPSGYFSIQELATTQTIQGIISSVNWKCIGTTILRNALKGLVRGMIFGGIDAWLGGGTIEDIVNGILSGGITGFLLGPLAMINRLRPVFIAFGLGSGIKGVYDSIKNGEYDQAAFRATFVILTLWELKKGVWDKRACFTEETLVLTEDGYKQIKDIQEEDFVYSENVETGEKGLKKVAKVFVREVHKLIHVYVDGEEINTTDTHPFWVEGKGWIEAGELKTGDVLRLYTGELKTVEKVEIEVFDRPVKVYNFEVEDWHTYYVTEQGVLVHNAKNYDGNGNTGVGNRGTRSTGFTNTQNASQSVAKQFNGKLTELKNGYKVEIPNPAGGNKPIVVRIMNEGSGGRTQPYFRVSIDGKGSYTLDGLLSSDRALTHIDMTDSFLEQITKIINNIGR
ncbi:hypothetical protein B9R14_00410 [Acetivibrio saccincola]|uniref:Hint domain-containing protein n=1 Tax=Acetivibrio saccincola TaxID=1677857 RepID=A0A2S8R6G7_9FIRM|nr:hypothetical protein B9R14_00410 [Acetivibrio saccincola]